MPNYISLAEYNELVKKDLTKPELLAYIRTRFVTKRRNPKPSDPRKSSITRNIRGGTIYLRYYLPFLTTETRFSTGINHDDPFAEELLKPWIAKAEQEQREALIEWLRKNKFNAVAEHRTKTLRYISKYFADVFKEEKLEDAT